jgi:hypothetical protein
MRPADKMEKYIQKNKVSVTSSSRMDERIMNDSTAAMENAMKNERAKHKPNIWRIIMESKITRYSTAACVLLVIICSVVFLDRSATPAYAVTETIEALKRVATVHIIGKDPDGGKAENWVKLNPETGDVESMCFDYVDRGEIWISTPTKSYIYYKNKKMVVLKNGPNVNSILNPYKIAEQVVQFASRFGSKVTTKEEYDKELNKNVIVYSVKSPLAGLEFLIDPDTRLPIRGGYTKMLFKNNEMMKYADEIYYNVPLPEKIFEFEMPEGVFGFDMEKRNELSLDPAYGILTGGCTQKEACEKIIRANIQAQIDKDVKAMRKLNAAVDATTLTDEDLLKRVDNDGNPKVELLSVGQPSIEKDTGLIKISSKIKLKDGSLKDATHYIQFREIDGTQSCVITGGK